MAKNLGSYKGFSGFYEIVDNRLKKPSKIIEITIYRSGYKFSPTIKVNAFFESDAIYEFRKAINDKLKNIERYPDLEDRNILREEKLPR